MLIVVFNLIATLKNCFSTAIIMIELVYVLYILDHIRLYYIRLYVLDIDKRQMTTVKWQMSMPYAIWHRHLQEITLVFSKYPYVKIHWFYFPLPPDITAFFVSYYMICAWQSKFSHLSAGNVLQSMHSQIVTVDVMPITTATGPQSANQRHKQ